MVQKKLSKAEEMAKGQRSISIAEFFEKNRHLLGFDNKKKALLTTVKEAVDNALDACEEAEILPEINIDIIELGKNKYRVIIEDNGPGIVKEQIPKIFAKLLYGSKFHKLKMSRGQQGIGISASVMNAQLTTGKPAKITSKTGPDQTAKYFELKIDTEGNKPEIKKEEEVDWELKDHGTKIELDLEGRYRRGKRSVDEYIKQTAIINPHVTITYQPPKGEQVMLVRGSENKPQLPEEIKPHPYGVELGMLLKMMERTETSMIKQFFKEEFTRVGRKTVTEILEKANVRDKLDPNKATRDTAENLIEAIEDTDIMMPPTDCIVPIGEEEVEKGMKKEYNAEFYTSVSRKPKVYKGNPFLIEVGLAYGGNIDEDGTAELMRFANRVPLLYKQGSCGINKSVTNTNWRNYGLSQSKNSMPQGPLVIVVHIGSVWVPFTSEAKEAVAHYPKILKEIKLAVQQAGRKLSKYVKKKKKVKEEMKKREYIQTYIPHIAEAIQDILEQEEYQKERTQKALHDLLERKRGDVEDMEFDPSQNQEYDEQLANIGKEDDEQ